METKYEIKQQDKFRFVEEGVGEPLILLHGLFGALSNFYGLIDYFRNYNKVIVPSLPLFDLDILQHHISIFIRFFWNPPGFTTQNCNIIAFG